MPTLTRKQAKDKLITGAKPQQEFWQTLMDNIVFIEDNLIDLFTQTASQAEALAGVDNSKQMTALRVLESIKKNVAELKGNVSPDGDTLEKLRGLIRNLENWKTTMTSADTDKIINTINDIKEAFNGLPVGVSILNKFNEKAEKTDVTALNSKLDNEIRYNREHNRYWDFIITNQDEFNHYIEGDSGGYRKVLVRELPNDAQYIMNKPILFGHTRYEFVGEGMPKIKIGSPTNIIADFAFSWNRNFGKFENFEIESYSFGFCNGVRNINNIIYKRLVEVGKPFAQLQDCSKINNVEINIMKIYRDENVSDISFIRTCQKLNNVILNIFSLRGHFTNFRMYGYRWCDTLLNCEFNDKVTEDNYDLQHILSFGKSIYFYPFNSCNKLTQCINEKIYRIGTEVSNSANTNVIGGNLN